MNIGANMIKIYKEQPNIISKDYIWVCICNEYLYTHDTLIGLLWLMICEWKHDRHLVG